MYIQRLAENFVQKEFSFLRYLVLKLMHTCTVCTKNVFLSAVTYSAQVFFNVEAYSVKKSVGYCAKDFLALLATASKNL
jgi:hypothetical protein